MSSLRSMLDELGGEDLRHRSDEELDHDYAELERIARGLQAEQARRLAEIQRRETWRRDGYLSTVAWLAVRFRTSWGLAMRRVREAASLEEMPATREALAEGELSPSALWVLVSAREAHPEDFAGQEDGLVEAATRLRARDLRRALAYWRQALDGPKALEDDRERWMRRRLYLSPTMDGMVRVDGDLDPETGQTVITALDALVDSDTRNSPEGDNRSAAQRRADALGEICRRWLDRPDRPEVGGERPHVTVTMDIAALQEGAGSPCEFDAIGPIPPEVARRWSCATGTAASRGVTHPRLGATPTTSCTGRTADRRRFRTSSCCAGGTIGSYMSGSRSG